MAKSPFSTAGGGNSDAKPHELAARKNGGGIKHRAKGGDAESATMKEAEGEDAKPRLDRKCGGAAKHAKGGAVSGRGRK